MDKKRKLNLPEFATILGASVLLGGGVVNAQYANYQQVTQTKHAYEMAGEQPLTITPEILTYDEFVAIIALNEKTGICLNTASLQASWEAYQSMMGQTVNFEQFVTNFKQHPKTPNAICLIKVWSKIQEKTQQNTMAREQF